VRACDPAQGLHTLKSGPGKICVITWNVSAHRDPQDANCGHFGLRVSQWPVLAAHLNLLEIHTEKPANLNIGHNHVSRFFRARRPAGQKPGWLLWLSRGWYTKNYQFHDLLCLGHRGGEDQSVHRRRSCVCGIAQSGLKLRNRKDLYVSANIINQRYFP